MLFDWDAGNWPKCGKHGVSRSEIESVFRNDPTVLSDPHHSVNEQRLRAIGQTHESRFVFIAFAMRMKDGDLCIRPISARYMHKKEIDHYVRTQG